MALKEGETEIAVRATEDLIYTNVNQHKYNLRIFDYRIFTIAIEGAIGPYEEFQLNVNLLNGLEDEKEYLGLQEYVVET